MPEDNTPEALKDFHYDPSKPPERTRAIIQFVGKLISNIYRPPREDYVAAGASPNIIQWAQEFEAQDVVRRDGTPAIYSNTTNVTDKNGEPLGEGSAANVLGLFYESLGVHIAPNTPQAEQYIGHYFLMEGYEVKLGRRRFNKFVFKPVQYYGAQCPPIGQKRVLEARDEGPEGTVVSPPVDEGKTAQQLADLCVGHTKAEVFNLVMADGMGNTVTKMFGLPFMAGLTSPDFEVLQALIDKGYLKEETDGKLARSG